MRNTAANVNYLLLKMKWISTKNARNYARCKTRDAA